MVCAKQLIWIELYSRKRKHERREGLKGNRGASFFLSLFATNQEGAELLGPYEADPGWAVDVPTADADSEGHQAGFCFHHHLYQEKELDTNKHLAHDLRRDDTSLE